MATLPEAQPRGSAEFVESSILEAVIPSDSEFDVSDEISSWDGTSEEENASVLPFLAQRQVLLFGKLALSNIHAYSYSYTGSQMNYCPSMLSSVPLSWKMLL